MGVEGRVIEADDIPQAALCVSYVPANGVELHTGYSSAFSAGDSPVPVPTSRRFQAALSGSQRQTRLLSHYS